MRFLILLLHLIFLLFVVCTAGICEIYSFSVLFPSWIGYFVVDDLVAYNNFSDTSLFISLSMSQLRGACGYLKGNYDSHSSCLNSSACSKFNRCVKCRSWSDYLDLAERRRSFRSRKMGRKKESKEKQQKGFLRNALLVRSRASNRLLHRTIQPDLL